MDYARKLVLAKMCITAALAVFVLSAWMTTNAVSAMGHILAFPILMYLVWGQLHGTGRSVRAAAFLGMAYAIGSLLMLPSPGSPGQNPRLWIHGAVLAVLALGVFISLKPRNRSK